MPSNVALRTGLAFAVDFRETGGTAITDWKSGKVGTAHGGVTLNQPGPGLNRSVLLNGTDGFVEWVSGILGSLLNMGLGNGTWEIWWKTAGGTDVVSIPFHHGTYDGQDYRFQAAMIGPAGTAQPFMKAENGVTSQLDGTTDTDDGQWHSILAVMNKGNGTFTLYLDGAQEATASLSGVGTMNLPGPLTLGHLISSLPSGYWHPGNVALARVWPVNIALGPEHAKSLWNDGDGLDLQTPEAVSITPNAAAAGEVVTVTSLVGDHFSANLTKFLLRKAGCHDIPCDSFTPSSLTAGAGAITIPAWAVNGGWQLVVVVNGEESAPVADAFTVTGGLTVPSTDVLSRRTRHYRCEEASGDLVDAIAGKIWSATALSYHQTNLLGFSVKGNGSTSLLEQSTAAGADAWDVPLAEERTYVFFVKTSTASVEVYMFKGYVSHAAGPYIVKNTNKRLRFQFADFLTNLTWDSANDTLPDNTTAVIVVRFRRDADGVSARVNGTEVVLSPLDTAALQEIIGGPTATAFAHRDDTNGNILASWSLSPHEQDETLVYDYWLSDAECALIENGGAFRDLSPVPTLDSVDISSASTLDDERSAYAQTRQERSFSCIHVRRASASSGPLPGLVSRSTTIWGGAA